MWIFIAYVTMEEIKNRKLPTESEVIIQQKTKELFRGETREQFHEKQNSQPCHNNVATKSEITTSQIISKVSVFFRLQKSFTLLVMAIVEGERESNGSEKKLTR